MKFQKSYPQMDSQIEGRRTRLISQILFLLCLDILVIAFSLFCQVPEFSLCPRMTNDNRKVSMPWNFKQAKRSVFTFLCQYCSGKAFLQTT
jgi:hypothetical protein